jgi:hypothetical protein
MPQPEYVIRSYGGGAVPAQLVNQIGPTDTSFTISPTTGWTEPDGNPLGTVGPFTIAIDRFTPSVEKILCSGINLSTGVVTVYVDSLDGWSGRGYDGSTRQAHVPGGSSSGVQNVWSADEAMEANQAVYDVLGAGGIGSLGIPVGAMIPYGSKFGIPSNFMQADGSFVTIADYPILFEAICPSGTCTTVSGSSTITAVSLDCFFFATNCDVALTFSSGGLVYQVDTVNSISSITLNEGTGISAGTNGGVTFFPWGTGDGVTNFKLPDLQGRLVQGQSNNNTTGQPDVQVGQIITGEIGSTPAADHIGVNWLIRVQ